MSDLYQYLGRRPEGTASTRLYTNFLDGLERLTRFFRLYSETICTDFGRCLVVTEPRDLITRSRKENMAGRRALNLSARAIDVEDVAWTVAFLLNCAAINGQTLYADNGQHLVSSPRDVMFLNRERP